MKHVIVTTSYRGVFYGQIAKDKANLTIELHKAVNVIYWSSKTKGFLGLSSEGPNDECRISAPAGGPILLHGITSVTECSDKAIEAWKPYLN